MIPDQCNALSAPLLLKKNGGLRDIAIFHGVIRTCTRARQSYCRAWEAANDLPCFAAGKARSATDVVWRSSLRAEVAVDQGSHAAAILWDMRAFFQMIRHKRMLTRAYESGFHPALARPAVRLYRIPRRLSLGRTVADVAVAPNRGVAPGCAFATTLVKVYCLDAFKQFVNGHPHGGLAVRPSEPPQWATGMCGSPTSTSACRSPKARHAHGKVSREVQRPL